MKGINKDWYLIDGKWHHCMTVSDGSNIKRYVDGIEQIYSESEVEEDGHPSNGKIINIGIHKRELTEGEIKKYNEAIDMGGKNIKFGDRSIKFDLPLNKRS